MKERGNAALKTGELSRAEILYSEALEIERSVPSFWTNRAIGKKFCCYLKFLSKQLKMRFK